MGKRKSNRPGVERRRIEKKLRVLADERAQAAALLPGGSADHPQRLESVALVEVRARSERCLRCQGELELRAHDAVFVEGHGLRRVTLLCRSCATPRVLWYEIAPKLPS